MRNGQKTQFSSTNQPSNKAKSAGWARRKQAQELMDMIIFYQDLTLQQFEKLAKDMKKQKSNISIKETIAFSYVSKILKSDKFLLDWIDRHISKAQFDKSSEQEIMPKRDKIIVEIIDSLDNTNSRQ